MITITNNNIYHSDMSISFMVTLDNLQKIDTEHITGFLSEHVELGESVTFKRLFEIISANTDIFNEIFYSALGGYNLAPYLQEIENDPTKEIESDYLEIYWYCNKFEDELTISTSLHGLSNKDDDDNAYAMDFISLNNIKNCVVEINEDVNYVEYLDSKVTTNNLGYKTPTLFELFTGILNEISFHGGPNDKKERFKSLEESISNIDMEELDTSKTTIEELMEDIDSKDKYLVKHKEQRERVDKNRISNKKNLGKLKKCLSKKLEIFELIENSDDNLEQYYKKLTNIEYDMQILYGEDEDIEYHLFWQTPKCTCPKIDNLEIYPSKDPILDKNCPIHKKPL